MSLGVAYLAVDFSIHRSLIVLTLWSSAALMMNGPVSRWVVFLGVTVLGAVAVAEIPFGTDLWFYQSYGRIVEEYRSNPYVIAPISFIGDPVIDRTVDFYRDTGSVYGPLFIAGAAVVSALSGEGELAGRLAWQGLAFVAALFILVLLRRQDVPWDRIFVVGASPVFVYLLINQAHNDVYVGLMILAGTILAERDRHLAASSLFVLAALVKVPAGIALLTYLACLLFRNERRKFATAAVLAAAVSLVSLFPFGLRAVMSPLADNSGTTNATSMWNFVRGDVQSFLWRPERTIDTIAGPVVALGGILVPTAIAIFAAWRLRHRAIHEPLTIALVAWVVLSLYPSVWLSGWFVALAGLWNLKEARLLIGYSSLLLITSQSWLLPVAAIVDRGSYGPVERLAATLLGITTLLGLVLLVHLLVRKDSSSVSRDSPMGALRRHSLPSNMVESRIEIE